MINIKQALLDPSTYFNHPKDILLNNELSRQQKIQLLKRWKSDIFEIQVAEEENMQGQSYLPTLEAILAALHTLDAITDTDGAPPTKQGG